MKKFEKLRIRLNSELNFGLPPETIFEKKYPGYWQSKAGAMKWIAFCKNYIMDIGSTETVSDILKAKKISSEKNGYVIEIFIEE